MDNKLDNDYIKNAIEELIKVIGIKEDYSFAPFDKLLKAGKIEEAVQLAASYLKLPIKIQLSYVSDKYNPQEEAGFQSSGLTKTDQTGKGIGGITAQVYIPSYLPPFGSPALQNLPIKVKVGKDCTKYPNSFIAVIAHELSHILLASLSSRHKDNEIYTDLTPMILGFSNIIREGRTTVEEKTEYNPVITSTDKNGINSGHLENQRYTNTTTYGYLTDKQFDYALDRIGLLLSRCISLKNKVLKENLSYKKIVSSYERQHFVFNKCLEYIDSHFNQKINKKDGNVLVDFHQQTYKDALENTIKTNKDKLRYFEGKIDKSFNATMFPDNLEKIINELNEAKLKIQSEIRAIKDDLKILKKYVSITHRLRLRFSKI